MTYQREEIGKISPENAIQCDLESIRQLLERLEFPITKEELLACIGDEAIPCAEGDRHTLRELLEPLSKEQYNSIADIQDAMAHPVRMMHF